MCFRLLNIYYTYVYVYVRVPYADYSLPFHFAQSGTFANIFIYARPVRAAKSASSINFNIKNILSKIFLQVDNSIEM